jgi:hypothetical protein
MDDRVGTLGLADTVSGARSETMPCRSMQDSFLYLWKIV